MHRATPENMISTFQHTNYTTDHQISLSKPQTKFRGFRKTTGNDTSSLFVASNDGLIRGLNWVSSLQIAIIFLL